MPVFVSPSMITSWPDRPRARSSRPRPSHHKATSMSAIDYSRVRLARQLAQRRARVLDVPARLRRARRVLQEPLQVRRRLVRLPLAQQQEGQTVVRAGCLRIPLQHRAVRPRRFLRHADARVRDRDLLQHRRVRRILAKGKPEGRHRLVIMTRAQERDPLRVVIDGPRRVVTAREEFAPPAHRLQFGGVGTNAPIRRGIAT